MTSQGRCGAWQFCVFENCGRKYETKELSHAWNVILCVAYKALSDVLTWNNVMKQTHYSKKYIIENTKVMLHNERKHHFGMYLWQNDKTNHLLNIVLQWQLSRWRLWIDESSYSITPPSTPLALPRHSLPGDGAWLRTYTRNTT